MKIINHVEGRSELCLLLIINELRRSDYCSPAIIIYGIDIKGEKSWISSIYYAIVCKNGAGRDIARYLYVFFDCE